MHWLFHRLRSRLLPFLGTMAILLPAALIGISSYAWSESLFVVLTMLMLLQFERVDFAAALVPCVLLDYY